MNRLANERSPYLRHASNQKIDWRPWSEESFAAAEAEDKPVFLSSGAIWCHWCHVMAKESFENEEIARVLNEHFIPIKLDRDERPEIDRRYQLAVSSMGASGGWPLSVFLLPDKRPFFGGTYFHPTGGHGRPGFGKVLDAVLDFYRNRKTEVMEYADRVVKAITPEDGLVGGIGHEMVEDAFKSVMQQYDSQNGGFGTFPKFPMAGAFELLMVRYKQTGDSVAADAVRKTLTAMAMGGFHDQLQGGFHRYSVDEAWMVPHFEKMADDNAWLLRSYIMAYEIFGDEYFRDVAEGIIRFSLEVLSAPEGGFYSSQDADVTPDDEGGYFTWTPEEFKNTLDEDELRVLSSHFFSQRGSMHHDISKYVLSIARSPEEISDITGTELSAIQKAISSGREKLLAARGLRTAPFIDKTIYTSLNGLFITAYLKAYIILKDERLMDFAIKSLKRVLRENYDSGELIHCPGVEGLLEDYVFLTEALLTAYEATGERSYLMESEGLINNCMELFWDDASGGFYDCRDPLLGIRLKQIEDIPHPSANAVAINCLIKLHKETADASYIEFAERSLKSFSGRAVSLGIHAGGYFCAMASFFAGNV